MAKKEKIKIEKYQPTTAEDKKLYKELSENFMYVINLTNVIEEKEFLKNKVDNVTLKELHIIEMVKKNENKPLTYIAQKLNVTVGSLMTGINKLIEKGYLIKYTDAVDKRITRVKCSDECKKVLKLHEKFHDELLYKILKQSSLKETNKVMKSIQNVVSTYAIPVKDEAKPTIKKVTKSVKEKKNVKSRTNSKKTKSTRKTSK